MAVASLAPLAPSKFRRPVDQWPKPLKLDRLQQYCCLLGLGYQSIIGYDEGDYANPAKSSNDPSESEEFQTQDTLKCRCILKTNVSNPRFYCIPQRIEFPSCVLSNKILKLFQNRFRKEASIPNHIFQWNNFFSLLGYIFGKIRVRSKRPDSFDCASP